MLRCSTGPKPHADKARQPNSYVFHILILCILDTYAPEYNYFLTVTQKLLQTAHTYHRYQLAVGIAIRP